jgi:hypothetical protein
LNTKPAVVTTAGFLIAGMKSTAQAVITRFADFNHDSGFGNRVQLTKGSFVLTKSRSIGCLCERREWNRPADNENQEEH